MEGIVLGEIIGSPYAKENIKDTTGIFFPLFENQTVFVRTEKGRGYRERTYRAASGPLTEAICLVDFNSSEPIDLMTEEQALCASLVYGDLLARSGNVDYLQAMSLAEAFFSNQRNRDVLVKGVSVAFTLRKEGLISACNKAGLRKDDSLSAYSLLLRGMDVNGLPRDGSEPLMAALVCLTNSSSWEEAVRRAVALGGNSALVGAVTGALAEILYGETPGHIQSRLDEFVEPSQYKRLKHLSSTNSLEGRMVTPTKTERFTIIPVLSLPGKASVYAIPEGREDISNCIKSVNPDAVITTKRGLDELRKRLDERYSSDGQPLHGTCLDSPRADYHVVYYDHREQKLYSVFTYTGSRELGSLEKRLSNRKEWLEFLKDVEKIRSAQETLIGHDSSEGHIHFDSAYYIETTSSQVRLMRGSLVCGEFGVTPKGELRVNPNAQDASFAGEYLEGAMNNRKAFPLNANSKQVLALLGEYCLDDGLNPLDESTAVTSNYDRMLSDLNTQKAELPKAVLPEDDFIKDKVSSVRHRYDYGCSSEAKTIAGSVSKHAYQGSLFTIGYSGIPLERLIQLLEHHGITVVCDARSIPFSKQFPQFNKQELSRALASVGISYLYHGDSIGDKPMTELPNSQGVVTFSQSTGGYAQRTRENAQGADLTLQFAKDFSTPGEKCTTKAADMILEIPLGEFSARDVALSVIDNLSKSQKKNGITVNIAGNGIFTLSKYGITQKHLDDYVTAVISELKEHVTIKQIRSGGQSGADQAGVIAAKELGIPVLVHAPQYWAMRGEDNKDIYNEYAFKSRFIELPKEKMSFSEYINQPAFRSTINMLSDNASAGIRTAVLTSDARAEFSYRFACLGTCMEHPEIIGSTRDSTDVRHIYHDGTVTSQSMLEKKHFPRRYEDNLLKVMDNYQEKLEENLKKFISRKGMKKI